MRLFFALWPPPETAQALARWSREVEGKAVPAGKIHLTLAFLGGAEPARVAAAARRVRAEAFELPIDTAKYWRDNHLVWAGPREMPEGLRALVEGLHLALYRAEFILERRPFAAHVTLVRKARRPGALPPLPEVEWPVQQFALVNSAQSRYETLEWFPIGNQAGL